MKPDCDKLPARISTGISMANLYRPRNAEDIDLFELHKIENKVLIGQNRLNQIKGKLDKRLAFKKSTTQIFVETNRRKSLIRYGLCVENVTQT